LGVGTEPEGLCFGTDAGSGFRDEERLEVSEEIVKGRRAGFVFDVVCGVVVHAVEVVAAFYERGFFWREGWEAGAELLDLWLLVGMRKMV